MQNLKNMFAPSAKMWVKQSHLHRPPVITILMWYSKQFSVMGCMGDLFVCFTHLNKQQKSQNKKKNNCTSAVNSATWAGGSAERPNQIDFPWSRWIWGAVFFLFLVVCLNMFKFSMEILKKSSHLTFFLLLDEFRLVWAAVSLMATYGILWYPVAVVWLLCANKLDAIWCLLKKHNVPY